MSQNRHNLVIPEAVMKALRVFIVNRQGYYKKGDVSKWVTIAINNLTAGINTHTRNTHNPYQLPKGRFKAKNLMLDICNQWIQSGKRQAPINAGNTSIPLNHLEQLIRDVTGYHDERTIRNYIKDLLKYGYLSDKGYSQAFLIVNAGTDLEHIESIQEQQKQNEQNNKKQDAIKQQEFDKVMEGFEIK